MINFYKDILRYVVPLGLIAFVIHSFLFSYYFNIESLTYSLAIIYTIVFMITFVNVNLVFVVSIFWQDKTGFAFMFVGMIKMILIIFLVVKLRVSNAENITIDAINIVVAYLTSLIPESIISIKLLKDSSLRQ